MLILPPRLDDIRTPKAQDTSTNLQIPWEGMDADLIPLFFFFFFFAHLIHWLF